MPNEVGNFQRTKWAIFNRCLSILPWISGQHGRCFIAKPSTKQRLVHGYAKWPVPKRGFIETPILYIYIYRSLYHICLIIANVLTFWPISRISHVVSRHALCAFLGPRQCASPHCRLRAKRLQPPGCSRMVSAMENPAGNMAWKQRPLAAVQLDKQPDGDRMKL